MVNVLAHIVQVVVLAACAGGGACGPSGRSTEARGCGGLYGLLELAARHSTGGGRARNIRHRAGTTVVIMTQAPPSNPGTSPHRPPLTLGEQASPARMHFWELHARLSLPMSLLGSTVPRNTWWGRRRWRGVACLT